MTIYSADIESIVCQIIEKRLGRESSSVNETHQLTDDLGADSLSRVEIAMDLEDTLNLPEFSEEWDSWHTVADVIASVKAAKGEARNNPPEDPKG